MDIQGILVFLALFILVIFYAKDVSELVVPTKKSKLELTTVGLGSLILLVITIRYGMNYFHYLLGILAILLLVFTLLRKGITSKGFRSIRGINTGDWLKLKSVRVGRKKGVRIDYISGNSSFDTHFYKDEDYSRIIDVLRKNLPTGVLKID